MYKLFDILLSMASSTDADAAVDTTEYTPAAAAATASTSHGDYIPLAATTTTGRNPLQQPDVVHKQHAKYFKRFLDLLPAKLSSHDSTR